MIKQIYIDDMTGEEITGEVYQIELSTVRGGDIDIPDDINAIRDGMHFCLESVTKIIKSITKKDEALEIAEKRIRELESEINQLRQLKVEFSREDPAEEPKLIQYEPPRVIPGPPEPVKAEPEEAETDAAEQAESDDKYDSIKGIDEGKLRALYEAGWNNKDLSVEFGRSQKAISSKIYLMIKQGKLEKRD